MEMERGDFEKHQENDAYIYKQNSGNPGISHARRNYGRGK